MGQLERAAPVDRLHGRGLRAGGGLGPLGHGEGLRRGAEGDAERQEQRERTGSELHGDDLSVERERYYYRE
ncbi:hypothetical protein D3C87_1795930 [compost metagenome]